MILQREASRSPGLARFIGLPWVPDQLSHPKGLHPRNRSGCCTPAHLSQGRRHRSPQPWALSMLPLRGKSRTHLSVYCPAPNLTPMPPRGMRNCFGTDLAIPLLFSPLFPFPHSTPLISLERQAYGRQGMIPSAIPHGLKEQASVWTWHGK